ncbi:MAG: PAS domain-containing sensor histidine kinase [Acidobacteria bacterium]|nr:MAG: PAS domain-containing sensor histidine kinase [Acidobacteriota bacterium]
MTHDRRVLLMALLAGLPGSLLALGLLWFGDHTPKVQWTCTVLVVGLWWSFAFALQGTVVRPLQTLSNLLAALREEDFSFRARGGRGEDSLGDAMREVNALAETLRQQRLGALEATALLRKVMEEIDVAVFAFDAERRLRLVNRSGQRLLGRAEEQLLGRQADELGLSGALATAPRVLELSFPGAAGRWEARRGTFRQAGLPLQLLVLSDVSRALREEERQAWQRLIRVLGHELNNSLAPIRSIAGSLEALVDREPRPTDWQADMRRGLGIITARSDALSRFMEAYARLARLPPPQLGPVAIGPLVRRVAGLETRVEVAVRPGPELTVRADGDQLEQLLINLLRNAADASLESGGSVAVGWSAPNGARSLEVWVEDEGPGLPNTANLFVPFFTTKPHGSGIGLVLSRQIAEAHGGVLTLDNRHPGPGCRAHLRLPL